GALLGRLGEASCPQPGGDVIGQRPIDVHLAGLAALGAEVSRDGERFIAHASNPLEGAPIFAAYPSVLGTHNLIPAAPPAGGQIEIQCQPVWARGPPALRPLTIQARPYPGLATGRQALVAVLLTRAHGVSYLHERVFDNRLLYAGELRKMGADVVTTGTTTAIISGPTSLHGARVQALDVRAGAALILAGLAAVSGRSEVTDAYHVDAGYERLAEK